MGRRQLPGHQAALPLFPLQGALESPTPSSDLSLGCTPGTDRSSARGPILSRSETRQLTKGASSRIHNAERGKKKSRPAHWPARGRLRTMHRAARACPSAAPRGTGAAGGGRGGEPAALDTLLPASPPAASPSSAEGYLSPPLSLSLPLLCLQPNDSLQLCTNLSLLYCSKLFL